MRKIVTHNPPRHTDDFLSIALLRQKYPEAQLEYVHPQSVPEDYLADPEVVVVDVGGLYDEEKRNYDHHHDREIPCSLVLVLKHEFPEIYEKVKDHPAVQYIDLADRFGGREAGQRLGVPFDRDVEEKRKVIMMVDLENDAYVKEISEGFLKAIESTSDYNAFLKALYEDLDRKGVLEEPKRKIEEELRKFREKVEKAEIKEINGLKVVYSRESFAPYHSKVFTELGADVIIERNSMNGNHTSIIKNTSSPKTANLDLSKVFSAYPKIFIHQTGFIAVVDRSVEDVDPEEVMGLLFAPEEEEEPAP